MTIEDYKYTFDLTDFGSSERFRMLIILYNFSKEPEIIEDGFLWKGKKVELITTVNPLTGEHENRSKKFSLGYASYMELKGNRTEVIMIAEYLLNLYWENLIFIKGWTRGE